MADPGIPQRVANQLFGKIFADDSMNVGKSSQLGNHGSGDCAVLFERVVTVRKSCMKMKEIELRGKPVPCASIPRYATVIIEILFAGSRRIF